MRFLGIDYGTKKIGIALSDKEGKIAFPYSVISNNKGAVLEVQKICEKEGVKKIILGKSVDALGRPNPIMKRIEKFKKELEQKTGLPVIYEPETFTTQEAKEVQGKVRRLDASSAALILQSFLERRI